MLIAGLQKTSLIDYPDKIAAIVFTQGCNFRCPYCHNPLLVKQDDNIKTNFISENDFFDFLKTRQKKLEGIVITGGEPTLQKDLFSFIEKIKLLNYSIKLDTNGTKPEIIEKLCEYNLVDYIAMDIKAPLEKYQAIVNTNVNLENIAQSISFIKHCNCDYEFRTTVVKRQLAIDDFEKISIMLKHAKKYYLQKFLSHTTLDTSFAQETTYSDEDFEKIKTIMLKNIKNVFIR